MGQVPKSILIEYHTGSSSNKTGFKYLPFRNLRRPLPKPSEPGPKTLDLLTTNVIRRLILVSYILVAQIKCSRICWPFNTGIGLDYLLHTTSTAHISKNLNDMQLVAMLRKSCYADFRVRQVLPIYHKLISAWQFLKF